MGCPGTGCTAGVIIVTVSMTQATTCTATFGHRLTVSARLKNGSPYTDVQWTSTPAGINCWTGCAANFPSGTVVSLFTSEMPSSWSGDCSMHQSLTMDSDKTCIAVFNNYLGPIRLGAQTPTTESATDDTPSAAPQPETAAPAGESGAPATFSAVQSVELGAAVVTLSMDTPTTLQVVEYYHLDVIGSVRAVTDSDGNVIARHDFRPFGEELSPQNPPKDRKLFTGQERDFETGLDYFYARQLRVDLGRFTAPDPMADLAWTNGVLGASNAYGYARSNPLGFVDPTGQQDEKQIVVHPNAQNYGWGTSVTVIGTATMWDTVISMAGLSYPITSFGSGITGPTDPGPTEGKNKSKQKAKSKLCQMLPVGRTVGVSGSLGLIGGQTGSLQMVVDYDTGEISGFATGGLQVGWNGGASASVSAGLIYKSSGGQFRPILDTFKSEVLSLQTLTASQKV